MTEVAELFRQFGPMGLALVLMGAGLVYLLKWLREEQTRSETERTSAHDKFSKQIEEQGARHERIIGVTVDKFDRSLERHGQRIDVLSDRVDKLDDRIRTRP